MCFSGFIKLGYVCVISVIAIFDIEINVTSAVCCCCWKLKMWRRIKSWNGNSQSIILAALRFVVEIWKVLARHCLLCVCLVWYCEFKAISHKVAPVCLFSNNNAGTGTQQARRFCFGCSQKDGKKDWIQFGSRPTTHKARWLASVWQSAKTICNLCVSNWMKEWVLCPNNVTRPTSGKISRVVAFVLEFIVTLHDNNVKFHIHSFIVCAGAAVAAAADVYLELMRSCF